MPPLPAPGRAGTCCGDATMPGHAVTHRSGNVFLATASSIPSIPSPSFLDEPVRERWRGKDGQGMSQTPKVGSPPGIYGQAASQRGSHWCPFLWSTNNLDLGPLWWLLGVLPHLPVAEREGSWRAAATQKHLCRACPLQPLPTFCFLLALFQVHFLSSPTWESTRRPEPTATILYEVIFHLSAENNTKVTPSYQRFQKKPNTSRALFRFNLIISLKRGFVLFVSFVFQKKKKKVPFFPFRSDLCLKVNNVLSHQGNGGSCFLPLYSF